MSSICQLSCLAQAVLEEQEQIAGFDETIGSSSIASIIRDISLDKNVVALETSVCCLRQNKVLWRRSFHPHLVKRVACNTARSIVAATMDNGTVSILKGMDGTVLATRRIGSCGLAAELSFCVAKEEGEGENEKDTLIIQPQEEEAPILLVSAMNGSALNSEDPDIVSDAARNMVIHAIPIKDDIRQLRGFATTKQDIRFLTVNGNGCLGVWDYHLPSKSLVKVSHEVELQQEESFDSSVTLILQTSNSHRYLVVGASSSSSTKLYWMNVETWKVAGLYVLPSPTRLVALEAVTSCQPNNCVAVVVVTKYHSKLQTKILQASLNPDNSGGIGDFHPVYHIPVPATVKLLAVTSLEEENPYSFRCLTLNEKDTLNCHDFLTEQESVIGSLRLHVANQEFDSAQALVESIGKAALMEDPFAQFHPSEIALRKLQYLLLSDKNNIEDSMNQSKECLVQLSIGYSHPHGKTLLLTAAELILKWPSFGGVPLGDIIKALSAMIQMLTGKSDAKHILEKLNEKLVAMNYLTSILSSKEIPLSSKYTSLANVGDVFSMLLQEEYFLAAQQLLQQFLGGPLLQLPHVVSSCLSSLKETQNPRHYANLLRFLLSRLSINHELLPPLQAWACRTADKLEQSGKLQDAIFVLEILERSTKELRIKVHSSFASHTPFVNNMLVVATKKRRVLSSNNTKNSKDNLDTSFASVTSMQSVVVEPSVAATTSETKNETDEELERPTPTILELGGMKGGAHRRKARRKLVSLEAMDECENCVESKLVAARCLFQGRELGLARNLISLKEYNSSGTIAKELVRLYSESSLSHDERSKKLQVAQNFCQTHNADFDQAIMLYAQEICGGKTTTSQKMQEAASLSLLCLTTKTKCQVVLVTLRAALFCRFSPAWLSQLSQEAIDWAAGDSSLREELEEASRLLLIDGIVGRYCGDGAKELFHVDNPLHAIRLVEYMAASFYSSSDIIKDTLDLCDAFVHLSREDACSAILQNAIVLQHSDATLSERLLSSLYETKIGLAKTTFSRVIAYCVDLIEESSDEQEVTFVTQCASRLSLLSLTYVHASSLAGKLDEEVHLKSLVEDFRHLQFFQKHYNIFFLTVSDLHNPKVLVETVTQFLQPLVESYATESSDKVGNIATKTKRVCSLLSSRFAKNDDSQLWFAAVGASACQLIKRTSGTQCLDFLKALGILSELDHPLAARCCLSVAMAYCKKAFKEQKDIRDNMHYVVVACSLLKNKLSEHCPSGLLGSAVTLGELCDIISSILVRSDEGIGEQVDAFRKLLQNHQEQGKKEDSLRPSLHPSWYVGDGLLLPPSETLMRGLDFCKQSLAQSSLEESTLRLYSFVTGRGAHSLALRVLGYSSMMQLSDVSSWNLLDPMHQTVIALAERSLGGSGNGILSGVVDSELAVSYLLCLPLKLAFKVYKSSLPTAMSTRDFERLRQLANIGKALYHISSSLGKNKKLQHNWKRQQKFVTQCHQLSVRAKWWRILKRHDVKFDLHQFEQSSSVKERYEGSLLPRFISNMSLTLSPDEILETATEFSQAFRLDSELAIQSYLEFLLSPIQKFSNKDTRFKLSSLEAIVKSLLQKTESPPLLVLRKCLVRMEASSQNKDYERLALLVGLYHLKLSEYFHEKKQSNAAKKVFLKDLELVDRRRDALAILSSYFQADKEKERPSFSDFFAPFPESLDAPSNSSKIIQVESSILGRQPVGSQGDSFDPLDPLITILSTSCNSAVTVALAPLCLPLGVPRGYIHARSLMARFQKSKEEKVALPSFEVDVMPVVNRLKASADVADFCEWCSLQYSLDNEDKLRSLDYSMVFAMEASSEAERHTSRDGVHDQQIEAKALERVKRISVAKDLLVDRLAIHAIMSKFFSDKNCALSSIVDELMKRLKQQVWSKSQFVPESFVEIFLRESSLLAAEASLNRKTALGIGKFQQLCILVHQACKSVAERYSHVQVGDTARRLSQRWLIHGDQFFDDSNDAGNSKAENILKSESNQLVSHHDAMSHFLPDIEEEDTINFVMDLNGLTQEETVWSADIGASECIAQGEENKCTSEEEPSSLKSPGCASERSDMASRRASLRIAFVMAYADDYHASDSTTSFSSGMKENAMPSASNQQKQTSKRGLLAKIGYSESRKQHNGVMGYSRELLRIVFAKSGSSDWMERYHYNPNSDTSNAQKTITFAMRHRALRASSILCPQEALEEVIAEEGYLRASKRSTLKKCSFGAYVAKEIEELGLPLPHSDLAQLSTVNFPSYARTLWRHHRDSKGASKGRLLLLIIDMYLKENISDYELFVNILSEIEQSNLPRTLLLALESTSRYMERLGNDNMKFWDNVGHKIAQTVKGLTDAIHAEFLNVLGTSEECFSIEDALVTYERLGHLVKVFCDGNDGQRNLEEFVRNQFEIVEKLSDKEGVLNMIVRLLQHFQDEVVSKEFASKLFQKNGDLRFTLVKQHQDDSDAMSTSLQNIEAHLSRNFN